MSSLESPSNLTQKTELRQKLKQFYGSFKRYYTTNAYFQMIRASSGDGFLDRLFDLVEDSDMVLEVGSSSGVGVMEMSRMARLAVGIDISPTACLFANRLKEVERQRYQLIEEYEQVNLASDRVSSARFVAADAERLPFKDGVFCVVFSRETLEHVPDSFAALDEIHRCLKIGGTAFLYIPIPNLDLNLDINEWYDKQAAMADKDAVSRVPRLDFLAWAAAKKARFTRVDSGYDFNPFGRSRNGFFRAMGRFIHVILIKLLSHFSFLVKFRFLQRFERELIVEFQKTS